MDAQGERSAGSWLEGEGMAADESVVASDGEGARTPPLVLSHPQPVEVVHIGESPSFIVRAEGEEVVSGSVVTRVIGGAWERHPLSAYTDGLWGVRLPVTSGMHDGLHYYFELETVAGAAETLQPQEGAYRVEVLR